MPLIIHANGQMSATQRSFTCSSVDILPFIYSLALGNESWRTDPSSIVSYLNNRESIFDSIMPTKTRIRVAWRRTPMPAVSITQGMNCRMCFSVPTNIRTRRSKRRYRCSEPCHRLPHRGQIRTSTKMRTPA